MPLAITAPITTGARVVTSLLTVILPENNYSNARTEYQNEFAMSALPASKARNSEMGTTRFRGVQGRAERKTPLNRARLKFDQTVLGPADCVVNCLKKFIFWIKFRKARETCAEQN
jgi:hypothetical protein